MPKPNAVKYSTQSVPNTLRSGNFYLGVTDRDYGPTINTGYYSGVMGPGYVSYIWDGSKIAYNLAITDSDLLSFLNGKSGLNLGNISNALTWTSTQSNIVVTNRSYGNVVTDGLVLNLDATYIPSYPGSGNNWYDLITGTTSIISGASYDIENFGNLSFDGIDDYVNFTAPNLTNTATVEMWCKIRSNYVNKMLFGWGSYTVYNSGGGIGFNTLNGDSYGISSGTASELIDKWTHFVFEMRSDVSYTNNKMYINGVQQTLTLSGSENITNRNFNSGLGRISGARNAGTIFSTQMNCSTFRVYNRSLTTDEILQNYNAGPTTLQRYIYDIQQRIKSSGVIISESFDCLESQLSGYTGVDNISELLSTFRSRVVSDGGIVTANNSKLVDLFAQINNVAPIGTKLLSAYSPTFGVKLATGVGSTSGNRAASKLYNIIGAIGDAVQNSASNQPLALVHSGTNYAWLPGVNGNFFSTPNAVANQITGDIDISAHVNLANLTGSKAVIAKWLGVNNSYMFEVSNAKLSFRTQYGQSLSTVDVPFSALVNYWIRVTRIASTGVVSFYTSANGTTWTQLGTNVSGTSGSLQNTSVIVSIGTLGDTVTFPMNGSIYRVLVSNSINGSAVVDFNPSSYNRATSQTSWTSSTGEVWTLNTPATNNALKAAIVDQTMIMGNGTSYGMRAANLNINQSAFTTYTVFRKYVNTVGLQVLTELGTDITSSQGFALALNTAANQEDLWINANAGGYNSRYTSNSLLLKVATTVRNVSNANEVSPYLINNVSQTFVSNDLVANNNAAMNATGYNILARNNAASLWANAEFLGDFIFEGEHDANTRTEIYNALKTYFNL